MKVLGACILVFSGYALCWVSTNSTKATSTMKNVIVESKHRFAMQQVLRRIEQGSSLAFSEKFDPPNVVAILLQERLQPRQNNSSDSKYADQFQRFPHFHFDGHGTTTRNSRGVSSEIVILNFGNSQLRCVPYELVVREQRYVVLLRT